MAPAQLAALTTVEALSDRASWGVPQKAVERIGTTGDADVRGEAALLARSLSGDEGTEASARGGREARRRRRACRSSARSATRAAGSTRTTGPRRPAAPSPTGAPATRGAAYEVAWRAVPRAFARRGRRPARRVRLPAQGELHLGRDEARRSRRRRGSSYALAATGQARLVFDGTDVARDDAVHEVAAVRSPRRARRGDGRAAPARGEGLHRRARRRRARAPCASPTTNGRLARRRHGERGARRHGARAGREATPPRLAFERVATPLAAGPREARRATSTRGSTRRPAHARAAPTTSRSPRAPGLLASLADASLDADRLAMAAWIAPSGANRSAWLNRAREASAGDARTRAFVERRLVERHIEAGLADWAHRRAAGREDRRGDATPRRRCSARRSTWRSARTRCAARDRTGSKAVARDERDAARRRCSRRSPISRRPLDPARGGRGSASVLASAGRARSPRVRVARRPRGPRRGPSRRRSRAFAGGVDDADDALAVAQAVAAGGRARRGARPLRAAGALGAEPRARVGRASREEIGAAGRRRDCATRPCGGAPARARARPGRGALPRRARAARRAPPAERPSRATTRSTSSRRRPSSRGGSSRRRPRAVATRPAERSRAKSARRVPADRGARRRRPRAPLAARRRDAPGPPRLGARPLRARDRHPAAHRGRALRGRPRRGRPDRDPARARAPQGRQRRPSRSRRRTTTRSPRIRWPELGAGRRRRGRVPVVDRGPRRRARRPAVLPPRLRGRRSRRTPSSTTRSSSSRRPTAPSTSTSSTARPTGARSRTRTAAHVERLVWDKPVERARRAARAAR